MRTTKVRDYEVGTQLGISKKFRVYTGERSDGKPVIMKVAKTFDSGDILAVEAGWFNQMRTFSDEIRRLEAKSGKDSHYNWLFARLEASFMEPTQGDRRINVFTLPDVDFSKVVPLAKLVRQTEIDTKTSIWVLGRLFKLYSFFELFAIENEAPAVEYPVFSLDNFLIEPEKHRIIYYNYSGKNDDVIANEYVKQITKEVLAWASVEDDDEASGKPQKYQELLEELAEKGCLTFETAHIMLYQLVDELWGRVYYPFTYRERETTTWKTIKEG